MSEQDRVFTEAWNRALEQITDSWDKMKNERAFSEALENELEQETCND